ncbi:MAG TPA: hypothetical protein VF677_07820, partial [Flavobacterium sp.]
CSYVINFKMFYMSFEILTLLISILSLLISILSFVYKDPKDLLRDLVQAHNSNTGKYIFKILSCMVSLSILIAAFFLAIGL